MPPFFSVVIPVYNKELYLERSILSVLSQTCTNFELIIIDDASIDNSLKKIKYFTDQRIKLIERSESGPGGYAARNLGIKTAKGEWVTFLDADDTWYPEHLESVFNVIQKHPDNFIVSSARCLEYKGHKRLDKFAESNDKRECQYLSFYEYLFFALKGKRAIGTNSICIKRECLEGQTLFPEGRTKRSGDLYAWVVLLANFKNMVWSPHVASLSYRDVIGVSRNSTPSIALFQDMVYELDSKVTPPESKLLKKYANRMIKKAWLEKRKKRVKLNFLHNYFFWKEDMGFCLKWSMISLVPISVLEYLNESKNSKNKASANKDSTS